MFDSQGASPGIETVLASLRETKARHRSRQRWAAGALAAAVVLAWMAFSFSPSRTSETGRSDLVATHPSSEPAPSLALASAKVSPEPAAGSLAKGEIAFERADDEEFMKLVSDKPAALIRYPDGRREFILIASAPSEAAAHSGATPTARRFP